MDRRLFAVPPLLALLALALVGSGAEADRESSYRVRGGRVRSMAVATRAASNRAVLQRYLALAKLG